MRLLSPLRPAPGRRPAAARRRLARMSAVAGALVAAGACAAGCGSSGAGTGSSGSSASSGSAAYPVTITNCGTKVTYDRVPRRAVSNDINTTEDMLALGLESRMVGTFGVSGDGPVGQPVPAAYLAGFRQVRDVSSDYFTKEELVGLCPTSCSRAGTTAWRRAP
jgi:ABC-type Fe3+-hydroxamate transport system substrate-binding protein